MALITLPESSLFLLLFSANIDTMDSQLRAGELSEKEEQFILKCVNKWEFYDDFYSQTQLESAIEKYQVVKLSSTDEEDFIEQCAEILIKEPPLRDITYYLCLEIIFLNGGIENESREEIYISNLEHLLGLNPDVANFIFGMEIFKTILDS
jgi:hypothetical protein